MGSDKERKVCQEHTEDHRDSDHPRKNLVVAVAVFTKHTKHTNTLAYMRDFKKHQPTGSTILKFFVMSGATLILFLLTVVAVKAAWGMYDTFTVAAGERKSAESQLMALKADHARLTAAVSSFETPEGVEREIRQRFGVALPGEGAIQIVRDQTGEDQQATEKKNTFLSAIRSFFVW